MTTDIPKLKNIMNTDIPVWFDKSWKQVTASTSNSTVWISQSSFVKKSNLKNGQNNSVMFIAMYSRTSPSMETSLLLAVFMDLKIAYFMHFNPTST